MKRATTLKPFVLFLLALGGAVQAHAQITFTEADVQAFLGATQQVEVFETENTDGLQAIADATGDNQTYDFSALSFTQAFNGTYEYISLPASGIPGSDDADFSDATFVLKIDFEVEGETDEDSTAWFYQRLQSDGLYSIGFFYESDEDLDQDGNTDLFKLTYDPAFLTTELPLTSTSEWTNQSTQNIASGGQTVFSATVNATSKVDGYGTLITSAGQSEALRYTTETTTSLLGFETTTETITFITKGGPAAAIELDENGAVMSATITNVQAGTGTPVEQIGADVPETYRLGQNYPNPFNPSTTIGYELKEAQPVRLSVHDVLGREVAVLVEGYQAAGGYDVTFEAGDLPSGLYLYRLEAGGEVHTRTMTLMK